MTKQMIDFAIFWLSIIGSVLLGGIAGNAWYGGDKTLALWVGFAGLNCFILLGAFQIQKAIWSQAPNSVTSEVEAKRLRAYVAPIEAEISDWTGGATPTATVTIKNTGQTPAQEVTWIAAFLVGDRRAINEFEFDRSTSIPKTTIPPGGTLFYRYTFDKWKPEIGNMIVSGQAAVFAVGEIKYKDSFGNDRFTNYQLISDDGKTGTVRG